MLNPPRLFFDPGYEDSTCHVGVVMLKMGLNTVQEKYSVKYNRMKKMLT